MKTRTTTPLIANGAIAVDGTRFPALRRALERGRDFVAKTKDGWAQVAELRRTGQPQAAERLLRNLLGVKSEPMSEETKATLRAKRESMTEEEKQAERDQRKADRVLKRLAARAAGRKETPNQEDHMSKTKKSKAAKSKAEPKAKKERKPAAAKKEKVRDPRIPQPGGKIIREYRGKLHEVLVTDSGFEHEGQTYPSLTALALKLTGAKAISGPAFFKLDKFQPVEATK